MTDPIAEELKSLKLRDLMEEIIQSDKAVEESSKFAAFRKDHNALLILQILFSTKASERIPSFQKKMRVVSICTGLIATVIVAIKMIVHTTVMVSIPIAVPAALIFTSMISALTIPALNTDKKLWEQAYKRLIKQTDLFLGKKSD